MHVISSMEIYAPDNRVICGRRIYNMVSCQPHGTCQGYNLVIIHYGGHNRLPTHALTDTACMSPLWWDIVLCYIEGKEARANSTTEGRLGGG